MRVKVDLGYGFKPTPEELAALKPVVREKLDVNEQGAILVDGANYRYTVTGLFEDIRRALPGRQLRVEPEEVPATTFEQFLDRLATIENLLRLGSARPDQYVNNRVNVHVPGFALMSITEVKVLVDECTENLDDWLRDGWRIIAVCPQPDQRRPDYVVGRVKERDE